MDALAYIMMGTIIVLFILTVAWGFTIVLELRKVNDSLDLLVQRGASRVGEAMHGRTSSHPVGVEKPRTVRRDSSDLPTTGRMGPVLGRRTYGTSPDAP